MKVLSKLCYLERMVKVIHARMPVVNSRNAPMTSIMVRYIINSLEIEFATPETGHDHRRLFFSDRYLFDYHLLVFSTSK